MSELTDLIRQVNKLQTTVDGLIKPEIGRWLDWSPTVDQGGAVAATITEAQYKANRDDVRIYCQLAITGAGVAANAIIIAGWPTAINPSPGPSSWPVGVGVIVDSGTEAYEGVVGINSSNQLSLFSPTTNNFVGANPSFALANGDSIYFNLHWKR